MPAPTLPAYHLGLRRALPESARLMCLFGDGELGR